MCCRSYGWTPQICLDMPIKTLLAMHRQAARMEIREFAELADIGVIPRMDLRYYFALKEKYQAMLTPDAPRLPPKPGGPVLEAGSDDARAAMTAVVRRKKQFMGFRDG